MNAQQPQQVVVVVQQQPQHQVQQPQQQFVVVQQQPQHQVQKPQQQQAQISRQAQIEEFNECTLFYGEWSRPILLLSEKQQDIETEGVRTNKYKIITMIGSIMFFIFLGLIFIIDGGIWLGIFFLLMMSAACFVIFGLSCWCRGRTVIQNEDKWFNRVFKKAIQFNIQQRCINNIEYRTNYGKPPNLHDPDIEIKKAELICSFNNLKSITHSVQYSTWTDPNTQQIQRIPIMYFEINCIDQYGKLAKYKYETSDYVKLTDKTKQIMMKIDPMWLNRVTIQQ